MQKIKESRSLSFLVLAGIYILAAVLGIVVYKAVPGGPRLRLLLADVAATVFVFLFSLVFNNASVYDPYWSVQPPVILTLFALKAQMTPVRVLLLAAVWYWGIRLTANWAYTFHGLKYQDWRYTMLHDTTGRLYPFINFTGIHLVPTIIVYCCILPAVYAMRLDAALNIGFVLCILVSIGAATLQLFADRQMHAYRKNKTTTFIRTGLWKYARHPNYLGEILMWWGIGLAVTCVLPELWVLLGGAALNTFLFLLVSIPMAEKRQAQKPGFAEYRQQTHLLLPLKKRGFSAQEK